jgi:hypothetical protein
VGIYALSLFLNAIFGVFFHFCKPFNDKFKRSFLCAFHKISKVVSGMSGRLGQLGFQKVGRLKHSQRNHKGRQVSNFVIKN